MAIPRWQRIFRSELVPVAKLFERKAINANAYANKEIEMLSVKDIVAMAWLTARSPRLDLKFAKVDPNMSVVTYVNIYAQYLVCKFRLVGWPYFSLRVSRYSHPHGLFF